LMAGNSRPKRTFRYLGRFDSFVTGIAKVEHLLHQQ
jgi:hypothetical protein